MMFDAIEGRYAGMVYPRCTLLGVVSDRLKLFSTAEGQSIVRVALGPSETIVFDDMHEELSEKLATEPLYTITARADGKVSIEQSL